MFCTNCGNEVDNKAIVCPKCGCRPRSSQNDIDCNSTGFNVLAFFFPFIGLIMYLIWKNDHPLRAQGIGKWALIGFCVSFVMLIIYFSIIGSIISTIYREIYSGGFYY